jgi:hypothetical protein
LEDEKKKKNKSGRKSHEVPTKELLSRLGGSVPKEVLDMPVDPNEPTYCVCQQVSGFLQFPMTPLASNEKFSVGFLWRNDWL